MTYLAIGSPAPKGMWFVATKPSIPHDTEYVSERADRSTFKSSQGIMVDWTWERDISKARRFPSADAGWKWLTEVYFVYAGTPVDVQETFTVIPDPMGQRVST